MKKILVVMIVILALALTACAGEAPAPTNDIALSNMGASRIAEYFEQAGLPIINMVVYTEETDIYNALGRPDQFTSKVLFADSRLDQFGVKAPLGGSIEVFATAEDAAARATYIELIFDILPAQGEYIYLLDNVLVRVDRALAADEAAAYQTVLQGLADGRLVVIDIDAANGNQDNTPAE